MARKKAAPAEGGKVIKIGEAKRKAAKAAKAPPARGSVPGDNLLPALTDDQRRGLFLNGVAKLERLLDVLASATSAVRAQRKVMKSEGFEKGDVDFGLWVRKAPEIEVRKLMETQAKVLAYLAHPLATQADLFNAPTRVPLVDAAFDAGKAAGLEGLRMEPPHDASTEAGQAWLRGWHDGQAVLSTGFKAPVTRGMPSAKRAASAAVETGGDPGDGPDAA